MNENTDRLSEGVNVSGQGDTVLAEPPLLGPVFDRLDWFIFGMTTVVTLAVYLLTLAPEVTLEFSGIFATGAKYAGVPHPPGFPVWTLYAWLFAVLLPFSNIAWRVAVSSAVAGALTCGVAAMMVSRGGAVMLDGIRGLRRCKPKEERWVRTVAGFVAGMTFGLDRVVWSQAVIVEAWTLSLLLFSLVLCLLMRWTYRSEQTRYLYAALFVYGLSLGSNSALVMAFLGLEILTVFAKPALGRDACLITAVLVAIVLFTHAVEGLPLLAQAGALVLPFLVGIAIAMKTRNILGNWKSVAAAASCLVSGLCPYLYMPVASMTNPPVNWAYPRTLEGYLHLISRGQYERMRAVDNLGRFGEQVWFYAKAADSDFGLIYLLLALVPFWFLRRMPAQARGWVIGLLCLWFCLSIVLIAMLNPTFDRASQDLARLYSSPSHLLLALLTGYGLVLLGTVLARPKAAAST
ncbi:MAG TPA: DUF2723 domain-containing protein [Candidatus Acidoferrum sp.]|jgi:hypothetical protein|nr:DUF2723 domain-containing protein [Candidatus Acidoferrum sp.]